MEEKIDNEILISLVQDKPVLWDQTLPNYKDRNATKNAWKEVCCGINKDFEEMEGKDKNEFGRAVMRRWTNLRDAFSKSRRKLQDCKKGGPSAPNIKKYVYNNEMQFLNKLYNSRETADSLETVHKSEDRLANNEHLQPTSGVNESVVTNQEKKADRCGNRKRRKPDEFEMLKVPEPEKPNSHMSFFQGVMPHLNKFDDSEVLEFQMGVLQVISMINDRRKPTQLPTCSYHPQQFFAPQSHSFSNPQSSCSSYFHSPHTCRTFFQQPQLFNSQNKPFSNPTNHKNYTLRRDAPPTQSPAQYYRQVDCSPDIYPTDNHSPTPSGTSENFDFATDSK